MEQDPIDSLIDRVADAVVRKIEEQQKIDAIAQAVLGRLEPAVRRKAQSARRKTARATNPQLSSQKPNSKSSRATGTTTNTNTQPRSKERA